MQGNFRVLLVSAIFICCGAAGCGKQNPPRADEHEHAHVHGPHDGELIELGNEEYHAELVRDEQDNSVTIYLLDKDASAPVKTAEPELTITISLPGSATPFKLMAQPLEGEGPGSASRFASTDAALSMALDNDAADRELTVKIGEKTYTGTIEHFDQHHHQHAHEHPSEN